MTKTTVLKIVGIVAIAVGSVALYVSGASEIMVTGLVGGFFVVIGLIVSFFK